LFVNPQRLQRLCGDVGIDLTVRGVRPSIPTVFAWLARRRDEAAMRITKSVGMVYQGFGVKKT